MVRQKHSRNANPKRNRNSFQEEKLNAKLREYDILADNMIASMETQFKDTMEAITHQFKTEKNRMPKRLLQMRMGDLILLTGVSTFSDLNKPAVDTCDTFSSANSSQLSPSFPQGNKDKTGNKLSKADEGYLTEDSGTGSASLDLLTSVKTRPYGPLASAMKNRRRSRSVSANATPAKNQSSLLFGIKSKRTVGDNGRLSRSKLRTPANEKRLQTVSADRGMSLITPKVQPNTPMAILRHARIGESIYSVTGSPVITSAMIEETANVNIPIADGILSIRPTEMESVDANILQRIDLDTLEHLKKLQMNLNKIMQIAEKQNFRKV